LSSTGNITSLAEDVFVGENWETILKLSDGKPQSDQRKPTP
jgi:hypothetical protein